MTQSPTFLSTVEHIMDGHAPFVYAEEPVSAARAILEANDGSPVAVIETDGTFRGSIDESSLLMDDLSTAGSVARRARLTAGHRESAFDVVSRMLSRRVEWVPVLEGGKLVGVITRDCVKSAYGETYSA